MKISEKGLALIQRFEGCSLRAYRDRVGVWTIGWGTTNADKALTGVTIRQGLSISRATAEDWLRRSLDAKYGPKVTKYSGIYHWTQNEFDALVSFAYNIGGIDQLTSNGKRTRKEIEAAWTLYDKAGGRHVKGLLERRQAELRLFQTLSPAVTGNPYPEPTGTVASNQTAEYLHLQRWIPQGEMVKAVQWHLVRLGYDLGKPAVDGRMGPKTDAAVEAFQRAAGLTVDKAVGPKTWAALSAAKENPAAKAPEKPMAKAPEKPKAVDYRLKVSAAAKVVYPLCVGKVHSGADVGKVDSLAALKAHKALSCNRMASITMQQAGLLDKGVVVSHTKKREGKKTIDDAVSNWRKLRHCKVVWVNKCWKDLPEEYKKAGCVYFQNSNACISAGNGKIWSCNKSRGYHYKGRGDYLRTEGYPFTSRILVVVVPD